MNNSEILAIVVSFNGLQATAECVKALIGDVGGVLIVDNGSESTSLEILYGLSEDNRITLECLGENLGMGHALNIGARFALENGYRWLLTMDQDSLVDKNMIPMYLRTIEKHPMWVCLSPSIADHGMLRRQEDASVKYAITSGNLVRADVVRDVSFYDEALFIDSIDFDFSLRLRAMGHSIHRVGDAVLWHQLGAAHEIPSSLAKFYTSHSPLRRYYTYRNLLYMIKKHFFTAPGFITKLTVSHVLLLPLIITYDNDPKRSLRMIAVGIMDYLLGRMGRREEV